MEENIKPKINKKEKIKLAVLVASILMIVSSLSYAFFVAATSTPAITDVDLTTERSEALIFTPGTPINLVANLTNFAENAGSLTESTTSTATLRAASSVGNATEEYYVYFNIKSNDFEYTVDANTPEMLLTITDPEGNEIIDIDGLTHKTVRDAKTDTDISGFDVTTYEGLIIVKELYSITTTNEITQDWTATITFINLNSDQTPNEGKTFDSELILRQDEMIIMSQYLIANHGESQGLLQHTAELVNGAGDDNYRYSGSNSVVSSNWVCFGSDGITCPEENKYRIIGVYDGSVKLIKSEALDKDKDGVLEITSSGQDTFQYDAENNNDYETSDIKVYLNGEFYNSIPASYQLMIKDTTWYVGGNDTGDETAYEFYSDNIGEPVINKISTGKIGLMYASDYGYATHTDAWITDLSGYNNQTIIDNNWLFNLDANEFEWTIVPRSINSNFVWYVHYIGYLSYHSASNRFASRPVLYLESNVEILSGTGSEAEPFRIGM